jgi:hypothetical protein
LGELLGTWRYEQHWLSVNASICQSVNYLTVLTLLPLANQLAVRPIRYVAVLEAAKLWNLLGARGVVRRAT